jgi:DNA sulfur modification protein DndD
MLLTKITLNDFGVYRGRNEFDFRTTSEKPIILCGGTNGSGKTTLFDSIMLCLYGQKSFEQKISQKQYLEIISRSFHRFLGTKKAADETSIIVEFQFAHEGKIVEYQVMRMWQNNDGKIDEKLSIQKKTDSDQNFTNMDSIEELEWQTFIDQLLPRGITKLFFFDGEKIQNIAEASNTDQHISSSFDSLLGLDLVKQLIADIGLNILRESKGETQKILDEIDLRTEQKREAEERLAKNIEKQAYLTTQIQNLQQKLLIQEEKFKKLGGEFANKREQLTLQKAKLESKLENIEREIRELCSGILPLSIIPKQLEILKDEIIAEQQKIQYSFEKYILENNFNELTTTIKSDTLFSKYGDDIKSNFLKKIEEFFNNKLNSISNIQKTTFNFSLNDMDKILLLIESINETAQQKIESLAKLYNIITNSLERTKVGLDSAPKEDEIGPIFSELTQTHRELGELENELERMKTLAAQDKSLIVILNAKIRENLTKRNRDKRRIASLEMGSKVQESLEEYAKLLRRKKLELLEGYILDGIKMLLHKKDFIEKVTIDKETFEVQLFKGNDDEITKNMLSKGELQMFATAVVWALAKTSGRPLPFMIDTPLARLDEEHRQNIVENFYPYASHQIIILSTDSEINFRYHEKLKPHIAKSFVIQYDSDKGKTVKHDGYFFDDKGEKIIEV